MRPSNKKIVKMVNELININEVARRVGITRQRVYQIYEKETGMKSPFFQHRQEAMRKLKGIDWKKLAEVKKLERITSGTLASMTGLNEETVRHIFSTGPSATKYHKIYGAVRVINALDSLLQSYTRDHSKALIYFKQAIGDIDNDGVMWYTRNK